MRCAWASPVSGAPSRSCCRPSWPTRASRSRRRPIRGRRPAPGSRRISAAAPMSTVEELCADPGIDAVYVATPHGLHAQHVALAAANGKHVLVEKPMAITLDGLRGHDRGGPERRRQADRRPQPQLQRADPAGAPADRQRPLRPRAHDHRPQLHRFPVSAAPPRGTGHGERRRRPVQPGRASGRHRPSPRRRPRAQRARSDRRVGRRAPDGRRLQRLPHLRGRRLRVDDV